VSALVVTVASLTEVCEVCEDGEVIAFQPGSSVGVVLPCPHCQGWPLIKMGDKR
jgi:hypothetical protein